MSRARTPSRRWTDVVAGVAVGAVAAGAARGLDAVTGPWAAIATGHARGLLAASFTALVTAGAFAFWMLPLAAQLAASSVPPPTVASRLHDRFQRQIITVTAGALTATGVVLLGLPADATASAPTSSTVLGGALGVGAIAGLLVAIRHAERSTRPGVLVTESAVAVVEQIRRSRAGPRPGEVEEEEPYGEVDGAEVEVTAPETGWFHALDEERLLHAAPPRSTVRLHVGVGAFVVQGWTVMATVHGPVDGREDELRQRLPEFFRIGAERAAEMDLVGSLSRFTDIAVHAATGGSGSPSTVYETIWYLGAILHELVRQDLRVADRRVADGRVLERHQEPAAAELANLAVDRLRQVTASQPAMALELVRVLVDVCTAARAGERGDLQQVLRQQIDLVVAQCRHADPLPVDLERVVAARDQLAEGEAASASRAEEYPAKAAGEQRSA